VGDAEACEGVVGSRGRLAPRDLHVWDSLEFCRLVRMPSVFVSLCSWSCVIKNEYNHLVHDKRVSFAVESGQSILDMLSGWLVRIRTGGRLFS
jgi:hypothetical protein